MYNKRKTTVFVRWTVTSEVWMRLPVWRVTHCACVYDSMYKCGKTAAHTTFSPSIERLNLKACWRREVEDAVARSSVHGFALCSATKIYSSITVVVFFFFLSSDTGKIKQLVARPLPLTWRRQALDLVSRMVVWQCFGVQQCLEWCLQLTMKTIAFGLSW